MGLNNSLWILIIVRITVLALFQVIKRRFVADEITAAERLRQF